MEKSMGEKTDATQKALNELRELISHDMMSETTFLGHVPISVLKIGDRFDADGHFFTVIAKSDYWVQVLSGDVTGVSVPFYSELYGPKCDVYAKYGSSSLRRYIEKIIQPEIEGMFGRSNILENSKDLYTIRPLTFLEWILNDTIRISDTYGYPWWTCSSGFSNLDMQCPKAIVIDENGHANIISVEKKAYVRVTFFLDPETAVHRLDGPCM